ncbi:Alkaline phosphatase [hydrothermal vent metagenome]|uniref:Alkaline phosphatase n=1 Tax=hydrothermal vent metagenome TaxID=652676 RepID=A0A3B0XWN1_9ZZZZ
MSITGATRTNFTKISLQIAACIGAIFLSACGGGGSSTPSTGNTGGGTGTRVTIGGTMTGNTGSVTLSLNGTQETFSASPFTFTQDLAQGSLYVALFISTPTNQQCTINNAAGTANSNITNLQVICNAPITLLRYPDAQITGSMTSGDFDGDGFTDLVFSILTLSTHTTGANNDMFRITYGNATGTFSGITDIARLGSSDSNKQGHHLIAGDFNGDGLDDFAFAAGNVLELFAGNATRNHTAIYRVNDVTRVIGETLYALDADGDNDLDLITSYFNPVLTTNAAGNFDSSQQLGRDQIGTTNLTLGDFNGDNKSDILVIGGITTTSLGLGLYTGNNSGSFDQPLAPSLSTLSSDLYSGGFIFDNDSKELAAGDFDADGDLDVAITSTTGFVQVMENNGSGRFSAGQRVTVGTRPIHIRVADFDLDGKLDLATINQDSKTVVISPGNGDGTFIDNAAGSTGAISISLDRDVDLFDMNVSDIDNNGYPDIILAENGTNPPNTGRGSVQILFNPAQ